MIDAAAGLKANIVCLQEAWTGAFFFCTRERYPWSELAEDPETGRSTRFIQKVKRKNKQKKCSHFHFYSLHFFI